MRCLGYPEFSRQYTGCVLELEPMTEFRQVDECRRVSLGALIGKLDGWRHSMALIFAIAAVLEAFALAMPIMSQKMLDEVIVSRDLGMHGMVVFGMVLLIVVQALFSLLRGQAILHLTTHLNLQWGSEVVGHLLRLPMPWFEKHQIGDVLARFASVGAIQDMLTTRPINAVLDGLMAVAACVVMLFYGPLLTMIAVTSVALYALVRVASYRSLRNASAEAVMLGAREQSFFMETIRAIQTIKLFGRELDCRARWRSMRVEAVNRSVRTQTLGLWVGTINQVIGGVAGALVLWLGVCMVLDGRFSVGMLFAFMSYSAVFGTRMIGIINVVAEYKLLSLHCERLADIALEPAEPEVDTRRGSGRDISKLVPCIELRNVSLRYGPNEPWVLDNVSLTIGAGESVAITGPSGCGKTTLVNLMAGMLKPTEGEILYGGVPLDEIGPREYRTVLAAVMQNSVMPSGSVAEIIASFSAQPDLDLVVKCAMMANVYDAIMAMPMRYETLIGVLSGGQLQRVAIAAALYKKTMKVLFLDEATSALDTVAAKAVSDAIANLTGTTRIFIAHQPETIASAGRVVALHSGQVVHDAVIAKRAGEGAAPAIE